MNKNIDAVAVLREIRETLQRATENEMISGIIWRMHGPETLSDFIDSAIEKADHAATVAKDTAWEPIGEIVGFRAFDGAAIVGLYGDIPDPGTLLYAAPKPEASAATQQAGEVKPIGYIRRDARSQLLVGGSLLTAVTRHAINTDDVAIFDAAPISEDTVSDELPMHHDPVLVDAYNKGYEAALAARTVNTSIGEDAEAAKWKSLYEAQIKASEIAQLRRDRAERMGLPIIDDSRQPCQTEPAKGEDGEPDMLWQSDDTEVFANGPDEFSNDYACNCLRPGEDAEVKVDCAYRGSARTMRIAVVKKGDDAEVVWKWVGTAQSPVQVNAESDSQSVRDGWKLVPVEPTQAMISAMSGSRAVDDEGGFDALCDLIGYSGENKTHTVLKAAYRAMLAAAPSVAPVEAMTKGGV